MNAYLIQYVWLVIMGIFSVVLNVLVDVVMGLRLMYKDVMMGIMIIKMDVAKIV
jgi:hypothetical protein